MKLLNVRLGPAHARMAARLRATGVLMSPLVRDAIEAAYRQHAGGRLSRRRPSQVMAEIYRAYPHPPGQAPSRRDLRDRREVRRAIRRRLRPPP
jgi:hypothetical protein